MMGLGQILRIDRVHAARIGAMAIVLALATGCERESDLAPPAKVQIACASAQPSTAQTATPMVLVLDTGDRSVHWANGPGAPTGVLTVENHQYLLRFGEDEPASWRATLNRFDGTMMQEVGKPGPAQTRQQLICKPETEGPMF